MEKSGYRCNSIFISGRPVHSQSSRANNELRVNTKNYGFLQEKNAFLPITTEIHLCTIKHPNPAKKFKPVNMELKAAKRNW
jgi:hypothetical protein